MGAFNVTIEGPFNFFFRSDDTDERDGFSFDVIAVDGMHHKMQQSITAIPLPLHPSRPVHVIFLCSDFYLFTMIFLSFLSS